MLVAQQDPPGWACRTVTPPTPSRGGRRADPTATDSAGDRGVPVAPGPQWDAPSLQALERNGPVAVTDELGRLLWADPLSIELR
jgi:hypothetical protein